MTAKREYLEAALRRCESEAIHLIGLVQPHGVVLALGPEPDYLILQASENVQQVFQQPLDHLLGAPLTQLLGQDHVRTLMTSACAESDCSLTGRLVYARVDGEVRQFHAMPHRVGPLTLLEIEPIFRPFEPKHLVELQEQVRQTVSVLEKLPGLDDCLPFLASQIRLLTGYDRVTVYRFDRDWEGEVIAESLDAERLPSYLGHRFPAGDIPPQARALYEKNPFRLFVDTEVEPSRVVPTLNPLTAAPLDLSQAMLRSFSPVHIEYLRNMDVRAVMSVALLVDGKLWGLIACHHKTPKGLDPPTREMVKFLGVMASMKISALVAAERERISQRINDTIRLLLGLLGPGQPGTLQLVEFDRQLKRLIDATGILIRVDGRFYRRGVLPDDDALQALIAWLDQAHGAGLTVIEQLSARYPQAAAYADIVAGVLAVCLDPVNGDGIYWFRPERSREVKWAGNPEKVLAKDRDGGLMISPRLSFATWTETWRGRSQSWLDEEIELGQRVAAMLHRAFHLILDASMRRPGAPLVEAAGAIDIDPQPLLRNLPAGVVVHAADTRILYANPRALALLRLTEEQALGRQALRPEWQLIDESSRPLPVADYPVNRVLASGGSMSGQVIGIVDSAFGRPTWVLVHAYPQIEAGGDLQVIVTFVEIGDQQRIPFRQIVDLAADVVVVTEADVTPPGPRIVYVNEAMITLSGYRGDEIIGQTPRLFQGPQTDPLTLARIRDHLLRREIVHETVLNYAKSGRPYWLCQCRFKTDTLFRFFADLKLTHPLPDKMRVVLAPERGPEARTQGRAQRAALRRHRFSLHFLAPCPPGADASVGSSRR